MTAYILSPAAASDLDSIWDYSADTWSTKQADRYVGEVRAAIEALADGRSKGRPIDNVRTGYFKLAVGSHFIVYRIAGDLIDVVRIVHQRMDLPSRLH
jgi:toxin ParE1/3/4